MEMIVLGSIKHQGDEVAGHWATKEVPFYTRKEVIYTKREVIYPEGGKPLVAVHNEKASAIKPSV